MSEQKKPTPKIVDLFAKKQAQLTLAAFDRMKHESTRADLERRADVERRARNKL